MPDEATAADGRRTGLRALWSWAVFDWANPPSVVSEDFELARSQAYVNWTTQMLPSYVTLRGDETTAATSRNLATAQLTRESRSQGLDAGHQLQRQSAHLDRQHDNESAWVIGEVTARADASAPGVDIV